MFRAVIVVPSDDNHVVVWFLLPPVTVSIVLLAVVGRFFQIGTVHVRIDGSGDAAMLIDCPFDGFPVILVEKLNLLHMLFHISPVISRPVPGKEVGSRHGVIAPAADRKTKGIVLRHRLHRISRLLQG